MATLLEQIGGQDSVDKAVEIFYDKVLEDDNLVGFFSDTAMDTQIRKMQLFLGQLLAGALEDVDAYMRRSHEGVVAEGLDDAHFDAVAGHLQDTLNELGVPGDLVNEIMTAAASLRTAVLNR